MPHHKRRQVARRLRPVKQTEEKQRFTIETNPFRTTAYRMTLGPVSPLSRPVSTCLMRQSRHLSRATVSLIPPANNGARRHDEPQDEPRPRPGEPRRVWRQCARARAYCVATGSRLIRLDDGGGGVDRAGSRHDPGRRLARPRPLPRRPGAGGLLPEQAAQDAPGRRGRGDLAVLEQAGC